MNRFFAVIAVLFCIGANVSAEVILNGAGSKLVMVNSETFKLKIDFSTAKPFYEDKRHWARESYDVEPDEQKMFKLIVGGCQVEMWAEECGGYGSHIRVGKDKTFWNFLEDDKYNVGTMNPFNAVVSKDKIRVYRPPRTFDGLWEGDFPCNVQFDKSSAPGWYVVNVSLSGTNISPQLVTTIDDDYFTIKTSTTTTTPVPTTTSSNVTSTTMMTLSSPQCEDRGLEPWLIGLIVAVIALALLTIALCVAIFCYHHCMQKGKARTISKSENTTVKSTMSTVSTAPRPLIKETNQYGPDMMYFARNATPVDPNAKN